jgi:predicted GNAT superfamily acetyltransferase
MAFRPGRETMPAYETTHTIEGRRFLFAVETSHQEADYLKYERLRLEIWQDPEDHLAGLRNLVSENFLYDGGSLFIAVYEEDTDGGFIRDEAHLAAFAYGYVGVEDKTIAFRSPENLAFYSQYAAVRPDLQNRGLGVLLKEFQREQVKERLGVRTITCTFDPLVGINAYRNIHIFGMEVRAYKDAYYEDLAGILNRKDVPSDRFVVAWDLESPRGPTRSPVDLQRLLGDGAAFLLTEPARIRGKRTELELRKAVDLKTGPLPDPVLVEIPYDYYSLLQETDVPDPQVRRIPVAWRKLTRRAFHTLFAAGYRVFDFLYLEGEGETRDFYVLGRRQI